MVLPGPRRAACAPDRQAPRPRQAPDPDRLAGADVGPILGTLAEIIAERRCNLAGVVDETQLDDVYHQWLGNGVSAWKVPLLRSVIEPGHFTGKRSIPWSPDSVHNFMHAKVVVADDVSFVGSFNLSRSGERNAENVLEIHDLDVADELAAYIDRIRVLYPPARCRWNQHARPLRARDRPRSRRSRYAHHADPQLILVGLCVLAVGGAAASASRVAGVPACPVFPADNPWNRRVDSLPVAADSEAIVRSIGVDDHMHADFGSGLWEGRPIGIPVTVVGRTTPRSRVRFEYADESDRVAYPIPANVRIEGGSDRHALLVDRDACRLYELFALRREGGRWTAGSGAVWSLRSNRLRPAGWTSADAAGLPILPGLARYEDVARGRIDHALRITVSRTRRAYVWPARHYASSETDPSLPPMGCGSGCGATTRSRGFPRQARIVLQALKEYGVIVADNGSTGTCGARRTDAGRTTSCTRSTASPARPSRSWTRVRCVRPARREGLDTRHEHGRALPPVAVEGLLELLGCLGALPGRQQHVRQSEPSVALHTPTRRSARPTRRPHA